MATDNRAAVDAPSLSHMLAAPPEAEHPSLEAAIAAADAWGLVAGVELVRRYKGRKDQVNGVYVRYRWECKRHNKKVEHRERQGLIDPKNKRPGRESMRVGCPMNVLLCAVDKDHPGGPWKVVHTGHNEHNHPPDDLSKLTRLRRRTQQEASPLTINKDGDPEPTRNGNPVSNAKRRRTVTNQDIRVQEVNQSSSASQGIDPSTETPTSPTPSPRQPAKRMRTQPSKETEKESSIVAELAELRQALALQQETVASLVKLLTNQATAAVGAAAQGDCELQPTQQPPHQHEQLHHQQLPYVAPVALHHDLPGRQHSLTGYRY